MDWTDEDRERESQDRMIKAYLRPTACHKCGQQESDCECSYFKSNQEKDEEDEDRKQNKGGFLGTGFDYVAGDPFW